jgi:hypothetical protein
VVVPLARLVYAVSLIEDETPEIAFPEGSPKPVIVMFNFLFYFT